MPHLLLLEIAKLALEIVKLAMEGQTPAQREKAWARHERFMDWAERVAQQLVLTEPPHAIPRASRAKQ